MFSVGFLSWSQVTRRRVSLLFSLISRRSLWLRSNYLNSIRANDTDVSGPWLVRIDESLHDWPEKLRCRRMRMEQNNTRLLQRSSPLQRDLPEVLVERQHDASLGLGEFDQGCIGPSGEVRASP